MTDPVSIPWGKEIINLSLPSIWQVTGRFEPSTSIPPVDVHEAVKNAINGPVMAPALRASIKPGMHVAIVIDDLSRPTPVSQILPIILDEITSAGVNLPDITVVPALGVHRPMSEKEVRSRMGDRVPAEIK